VKAAQKMIGGSAGIGEHPPQIIRRAFNELLSLSVSKAEQ
jgi:hypothetical protein